MEFLGAISFLLAFLFFRQRQRMRDKHRAFLDALNRRVISDKGNGKCYSSEWVLDNIVFKPKKLLNATPLLFATIGLLMALVYYLVMPRVIAYLISAGYVTLIALMGTAVLFWTDAFEAYRYADAIRNVATEQLDKEDQSYIELARESVEKAFLRFFSMGVAFALLGPFIPQIFNSVVYSLALYATFFFQASEASLKVSTILVTIIILIVPALMLFMPDFLGRILIRKGKSLARRLFKKQG